MALESQKLVVIRIVVKEGFNVRAMFLQFHFALLVLHNILHHCFALKFCHFTCLLILEGDIVKITNYDYDKYFCIAAWIKSGGSCAEKLKEKTRK